MKKKKIEILVAAVVMTTIQKNWHKILECHCSNDFFTLIIGGLLII